MVAIEHQEFVFAVRSQDAIDSRPLLDTKKNFDISRVQGKDDWNGEAKSADTLSLAGQLMSSISSVNGH